LVSLASLFLAGKRGKEYQLIPGIFRKAPQHYVIQVSVIVHEFQSQNKGIKELRAAGESDPLKYLIKNCWNFQPDFGCSFLSK